MLLAALRNHLGKELNLYDSKELGLLWVVDFPMFEYDDETQRYYAMHHPFTMPFEEDLEFIDERPGDVRAKSIRYRIKWYRTWWWINPYPSG